MANMAVALGPHLQQPKALGQQAGGPKAVGSKESGASRDGKVVGLKGPGAPKESKPTVNNNIQKNKLSETPTDTQVVGAGVSPNNTQVEGVVKGNTAS